MNIKTLKSTLLSLGRMICGCLLVVGCTSVPLGSLYKMATLDASDISAIKPEQVRARITLDQPAELQTREVKLALKFEFEADQQGEYLFVLDLLSNKPVKEESWFSDSTTKNQYEFELSMESQKEFRKYQREFIQYGKPKKYYWTVYYFLEKNSELSRSLQLDLELRLSQQEEYFYLLKDASIATDAE